MVLAAQMGAYWDGLKMHFKNEHEPNAFRPILRCKWPIQMNPKKLIALTSLFSCEGVDLSHEKYQSRRKQNTLTFDLLKSVVIPYVTHISSLEIWCGQPGDKYDLSVIFWPMCYIREIVRRWS